MTPKGPGDSHQHQGGGTAGVGHRPLAAGTGPAAHRGPDGRRSVASDFRRSCAADGGTVAPRCSLSS